MHGTLGTPCHHPATRPLPRGLMRAPPEAAPWAQGLLFPRVGRCNNVTPVTLLPHLRSISPGHPDRPQSIWGKCWIASRALLDRSGQGQRAWPGHPKLTRPGFPEVYPRFSRIQAPRTRNSRIPHQTKRRVFPHFPRNRRNPENHVFLAFPGSGTHSNQRAT